VSALADVPAEVRRALGNLVTATGVVAVSGGPDSVALLRALAGLRAEGMLGRLVVAHLNHCLRGTDSDRDEEFVRALHEQLSAAAPEGVLWRCARVDVAAAVRKARENLESAARRARYDWLAGVAAETGSSWVATGHTADDQAETVLHRLLRGTGLRGLAGIPARRPLSPGVVVVRPLLRVRRQTVLEYLEALTQPWRQDFSNDDLRFTRNRIRHELLPLLTDRFNPAVVAVLCRLAAQAAEARRTLEAASAELLGRVELPRAGEMLILDVRLLAGATRHLLREVFRLLWQRECWPAGAMGFREWDRAAAVAHGEVLAVDLPGGVRVRRHANVVQVSRRLPDAAGPVRGAGL
jgi:tRNA(Ile)-lysidine synthase